MKRKFESVTSDQVRFSVIDSPDPILVSRQHPLVCQSRILNNRDIEEFYIPCEKTALLSLIQWIDMGTIVCETGLQKKMDRVIELLRLDPMLN